MFKNPTFHQRWTQSKFHLGPTTSDLLMLSLTFKGNATPIGYSFAIGPALRTGLIASTNQIKSEIDKLNVNLAAGLYTDATLLAQITDTTVDLQLIVTALASITASMTITEAQLSALLSMYADIEANGTLTPPTLGAIKTAVASLIAQLIPNPTISATANIEADILSAEGLTPKSLAKYLWNTAASEANVTGTMGEKINDAGSASNPWTEVIESGFSAADILKLLAAVAAGKTTITDLGSGNGVVKFRDLSDSKDRIVATMSGSERVTITKDPS